MTPLTPVTRAGGASRDSLTSAALSAALDPPEADLDRLRTSVATAAGDAGLLDGVWTTLDSAIGRLHLAATPRGLARLSFGIEDSTAFVTRLAGELGPRILEDAAALAPAVQQLEEYLDGRRRSFDLALDLRLAQGFGRAVVEHLRTIPYGRTESYREVAVAVGSPRAVRAAGTACARNPLPLVVPCHRVLRSDGTVGQYAGGTDLKRRLLALEAG